MTNVIQFNDSYHYRNAVLLLIIWRSMPVKRKHEKKPQGGFVPKKDADGIFWRVKRPVLKIGPELDASDEAFWRDQEGRMTKQIGQPCCTLSGMTHLLIEIPGNFAVVLHSELDCTNCFLSTRGPSGVNFYSVAVTQAQFSTGQMGSPLERCLELIVKHKKPDAIFVLGNCLVEMVYDTYDMVSKQMEEKLKTPIIPLRTSGLKACSQADMVDWLYSTFAGLAKLKNGSAANGKKGSGTNGHKSLNRQMNLIGMPHLNNEFARNELTGYFSKAGLTVNGIYPYEAGFKEWMQISRASTNVVVDKSLYPRLLDTLTEMGVSSVEVPLPVGWACTTKFLDTAGKAFGVEEEVKKAYAPASAKVLNRLKTFRKRWAGLKVVVGLRMVNNYRVDQLAYDGLGDITTFTELGFDINLFIQGPGDEKSRKHFADRLAELNCSLPFEIFPDPYDLLPLLQKVRPDVVYAADHSRWETTPLGVPLIASRSLEPFFGGAVRNIEFLEKVLTEIERNRGGRKG